MLTDGSKAVRLQTWAQYQTRLPTDDELRKWFSGQPCGIGVVCGPVSRLEILDLDRQDLLEPWLRLAGEPAYRFPIVETPEGFHVWWRCDQPAGRLELAFTEAGEIAIETRGQGCLAIAPGSAAATHPTGRPYVQVMGPPLFDGIPEIDTETRKLLLSAAAALNAQAVQPPPPPKPLKIKPASAEQNPWDAFADNPDNLAAVLLAAGWTIDSETSQGRRWTRPGKHGGVSASECTASDGRRVLKVFSTNAGCLTSDHPLNAFEVLVRTRFFGDGKAAARFLRHGG